MPNGNELYGGTLADFTTVDNMAHEIELAYTAVRNANGITDPLPSGSQANDMRMMFVAIATGVINHLKNNPAAFSVQVSDSTLTLDGNVTSVSTLP
jgi:hypothetical protein